MKVLFYRNIGEYVRPQVNKQLVQFEVKSCAILAYDYDLLQEFKSKHSYIVKISGYAKDEVYYLLDLQDEVAKRLVKEVNKTSGVYSLTGDSELVILQKPTCKELRSYMNDDLARQINETFRLDIVTEEHVKVMKQSGYQPKSYAKIVSDTEANSYLDTIKKGVIR